MRKDGRAPEEQRKKPPAPAMRIPAARSAMERNLLSTARYSWRGIIERPSSSRETPSWEDMNFAADAKYGWTMFQISWILVATNCAPEATISRAAVNGGSTNSMAERKKDGALDGTVLIFNSSWLVQRFLIRVGAL